MKLIFTLGFSAILALACPVSVAFAQDAPPAPATAVGQAHPFDAAPGIQSSNAFKDLIAPLGGDLRRVASPQNLLLMGLGTAGALTAHSFDQRVSATMWPDAMKGSFGSAQYIGDSWIQAGGALAVYSIGRSKGSARVSRVGAELFRAQMVADVYTRALKYSVSRTRPDGASLSFPSGHTSSMFATATVLQSEFGWKVGVPAYVAAAWVGASRIEKQRHFLSDVIAGATIGVLAGRSVTIGIGKARFAVGVMAAPGGAGVSFTKVAKP